VAGVGFHAVLDEGLFPAREIGRVDLLAVLADVPEVGPEVDGIRLGVGWVEEPLRRDARRREELLVAGAAADDAGQGVAHLRLGRPGRALEEVV
jgi:hypothetical protein